jgi:hypothetical protein
VLRHFSGPACDLFFFLVLLSEDLYPCSFNLIGLLSKLFDRLLDMQDIIREFPFCAMVSKKLNLAKTDFRLLRRALWASRRQNFCLGA